MAVQATATSAASVQLLVYALLVLAVACVLRSAISHLSSDLHFYNQLISLSLQSSMLWTTSALKNLIASSSSSRGTLPDGEPVEEEVVFATCEHGGEVEAEARPGSAAGWTPVSAVRTSPSAVP